MHKEINSLATYFNSRAKISSNSSYANGYSTQNNESSDFYNELVIEIRQLVSLKNHHHVLDIGCGTGEILVRIEPHVANIQGIDISEAMATLAQNRGLKVHHYDGVHLPFSNETLDIIFIYQVLTNFSTRKQTLHLISEASRVLKKNGSLFLGAIPDPKLSNFPQHSAFKLKSLYSKFRSLSGGKTIGYFSYPPSFFFNLYEKLNFSKITLARCRLSKPSWQTKYHIIMEK